LTAAASPTYPVPPRSVRLSETPLAGVSAVSGLVTFAVIGFRAHMPLIAGTHGDFEPQGEFERLRVAVQNDSRTFAELTLADMMLVTADGVAHRPEPQAMAIKRQPQQLEVGASGGVQFDLYYDLPKGSMLRELRFGGFHPEPHIPLPAS
jgi:hypothetical protein